MRQGLTTCVLVAAACGALGASGGTAYADAGVAPVHRLAAELVHRRAPEPLYRPDPRPVRHRAVVPVAPARRPAARPGQNRRVGAVARAGASAGSALLAVTGADVLGVVAGLGGGLLLGGVLLLRRARTRRR
ncbi:hypothetical protein AB0C96_15590 [Streptomyces sp. NPDC048506]|uniref:hypothetical protein n=1 Tax=Streptomyces sp. NPDC048506 TaxID=3155028 RepID=UPI00344129D2